MWHKNNTNAWNVYACTYSCHCTTVYIHVCTYNMQFHNISRTMCTVHVYGQLFLVQFLCVQEPLESIITPAGFAPATHPPTSHSSQSPHTYYSPAHSSHPHPSQEAHSGSPSHDSESSSSYSTPRVSGGGGGGKTVPQSGKKGASPTKRVVTASNDESAASVSPLEGVPNHHDLIDPGPTFTNTGVNILPCAYTGMYMHTHTVLTVHTVPCVVEVCDG